ncbi:hypothetical protein EJ04DRAFT_512616 [Polyplosphaeria fusca]|uniref:Uncharacterized protein n=1 Tax=Polyplosphaeria fusca TaxID=682080 RepID=A0A9P4QZV9_9PLEO|nr:hypothetical protein EJ04DRAFT_512616 [Polyplosphaeria fusca]
MRLKTLNGAPLSEDLDFSEENLLEIGAYEPFFQAPAASTEDPPIKWRRLAAQDTRLRSGWSQPYLPGDGESFPFSLPALLLEHSGITANEETELDDFVQHSLIFHHTLVSSQIKSSTGEDSVSSSSFLTTSFNTSEDVDHHDGSPDAPSIPQIPSNITISTLGSLPNHDHLRAIYPQTMTSNLLCAVATQPERREVFVRKGGYQMHLYEFHIADDTNSCFKVSFWFRPPKQARQDILHENLRHTLDGIKQGDIILLQHLALSTFRNDVFGQGLNTSVTKARTGITVLIQGDGSELCPRSMIPGTLTERLSKVRKWASNVIGPGLSNRKRRRDNHVSESAPRRSYSARDSLPPDTMET